MRVNMAWGSLRAGKTASFVRPAQRAGTFAVLPRIRHHWAVRHGITLGIILLAALPAPAAASCTGQIAFLNHIMAVIDRRTADAVPASALLRKYASFEIRTTKASDGAVWTGRYVNGVHNYLELFGPGDSGDDSPVGSLGVAIGGDLPGITDRIGANLRRAGVEGETRMMRRPLGGKDVNWFNGVGIAHPLALNGAPAAEAWTMEFQSEFFATAEAGQPASLGPQDDVSRRRYLASLNRGTPISDISRVQIALGREYYRHNVKPLLAAAGFCLSETRDVAHARGGEAEIVVRFVKPANAGLERVDFALTRSVSHMERENIGGSTLRVGPGRSASWEFRKQP